MRIKRATIAILSLIVVACSGPKVIPDNILVKIFHDAFLANAYITEENINSDSLYIYEPIFERYGYTMSDLQHTLTTINERKSSRISNIMQDVSEMLENEYKAEQRKIIALDTIDNFAKRAYTRTVYSDSLIRVSKLRDTSKLRINLKDLVAGEYAVSFEYYIDTLDENRNSRVEAYLLTRDSSQVLRHTMMLTRYRKGVYSRKFTADSMHKELVVNMYYHPRNEESKSPDIAVYNFKIVRVLPADIAVDSLYKDQLNLSIFNHDLMSGFTRDTVDVVEHHDSTLIDSHSDGTQDSLALRTR